MKKKVYMLLLALGTILLCSCQNQPVSESKSDGQTEENSVLWYTKVVTFRSDKIE